MRNREGDIAVEEATRRLTIAAGDGAERLFAVFRDLDQAGISVDDIGLRRPTLDDVFLSITGHVADEVEEGAETTLVSAGDISDDGK